MWGPGQSAERNLKSRGEFLDGPSEWIKVSLTADYGSYICTHLALHTPDRSMKHDLWKEVALL